MCNLTHLRLGILPEREERMRQMLLGEQAEEISLVFIGVHTFPKLVSAICGTVQTGVVPGGNRFRPDGLGKLPQVIPLQVAVAIYARVGCIPAAVAIQKALYDRLAESLLGV